MRPLFPDALELVELRRLHFRFLTRSCEREHSGASAAFTAFCTIQKVVSAGDGSGHSHDPGSAPFG